MPMATCASAGGGSILRGGGVAAPAQRRLLKGVCLCAKICAVVLRWLLTQLGLLGGHRKGKVEQGFKLLSLQSLKHTYHLWIRVGGVCIWSRKLQKFGETHLSRFHPFLEAKSGAITATFSN
jgi:hypothetical protein